MNAVVRVTVLALSCVLLGACGGIPGDRVAAADLDYPAMPPAPHAAAPAAPADDDPSLFPDDNDDNGPATVVDGPRMQCVPYARAHSGVDIHGNANTWWNQAKGVYARGQDPVEGAVMVMTGYGRGRGHVAVVHSIVTNREIRIDHANWFDDGAIYVNDPVMDVSENNDWSQVKVWNIRTGSWGTKVYTVQGFIGPDRDNPLVASNDRRGDDPIGRQIALAARDSDDSDDDSDRDSGADDR